MNILGFSSISFKRYFDDFESLIMDFSKDLNIDAEDPISIGPGALQEAYRSTTGALQEVYRSTTRALQEPYRNSLYGESPDDLLAFQNIPKQGLILYKDFEKTLERP